MAVKEKLLKDIPQPGARKGRTAKEDDNWKPPKDYVSAPAGMTSRAAPHPPAPKFIHDKFLQEIKGRAVAKTFHPQWASGKLGTRIADHYDKKTDTIYEINTTPWETMSEEKLRAKLDQVSADYELTHSNPNADPPEEHVSKVIWVGDHPLPDTGRGGELKRALEAAGIEYQLHVRTPVAGH